MISDGKPEMQRPEKVANVPASPKPKRTPKTRSPGEKITLERRAACEGVTVVSGLGSPPKRAVLVSFRSGEECCNFEGSCQRTERASRLPRTNHRLKKGKKEGKERTTADNETMDLNPNLSISNYI